MARFCISVLMLLAMFTLSAVAHSPAEPSFWIGKKSSAAVSFWLGKKSPAPSAETPTPSPPSVISSPPSPTPTISPSAISSPPADAPGPSVNGAVSNGFAVIGSLVVALVAAVLVV